MSAFYENKEVISHSPVQNKVFIHNARHSSNNLQPRPNISSSNNINSNVPNNNVSINANINQNNTIINNNVNNNVQVNMNNFIINKNIGVNNMINNSPNHSNMTNPNLNIQNNINSNMNTVNPVVNNKLLGLHTFSRSNTGTNFTFMNHSPRTSDSSLNYASLNSPSRFGTSPKIQVLPDPTFNNDTVKMQSQNPKRLSLEPSIMNTAPNSLCKQQSLRNSPQNNTPINFSPQNLSPQLSPNRLSPHIHSPNAFPPQTISLNHLSPRMSPHIHSPHNSQGNVSPLNISQNSGSPRNFNGFPIPNQNQMNTGSPRNVNGFMIQNQNLLNTGSPRNINGFPMQNQMNTMNKPKTTNFYVNNNNLGNRNLSINIPSPTIIHSPNSSNMNSINNNNVNVNGINNPAKKSPTVPSSFIPMQVPLRNNLGFNMNNNLPNVPNLGFNNYNFNQKPNQNLILNRNPYNNIVYNNKLNNPHLNNVGVNQHSPMPKSPQNTQTNQLKFQNPNIANLNMPTNFVRNSNRNNTISGPNNQTILNNFLILQQQLLNQQNMNRQFGKVDTKHLNIPQPHVKGEIKNNSSKNIFNYKNNHNSKSRSPKKPPTQNMCKNSFLIVNIKLSGEVKHIPINKGEDYWKKASDFCLSNNLSEYLIKPIYQKISKACESLDKILTHDLGTVEQKQLDDIKDSYNLFIDMEAEKEKVDLSCITVIGSALSDLDTDNHSILNLSI